MKPAPIVLFVYNRPDKVLAVLNSLKKNKLAKYSELYVFSDGFKKKDTEDYDKVNTVREIIKHFNGFKKIKLISRKYNYGLYDNITKGLNLIFKKNKKAIILEDDIIVSDSFLNYMNVSLINYENDNKVGSICSNLSKENENLPLTFFLYHQDCWGWATWRRAWKLYSHNSKKLKYLIQKTNSVKKFNLDNSYDFLDMLEKNLKFKKSWAVNWYASLFINKRLNLYCSTPQSKNIGLDNESTNTKYKIKTLEIINKTKEKYKKIEIKECLSGYLAIVNFYKKNFNYNNYIKHKFAEKFKKFFEIINNIVLKKNEPFKFFGPFGSWQNALKQSDGYNDERIVRKTLSSALKVKNKKYLFERDSVLFNKPSYNWKIILNLLKFSKKNLNLIDFGGSFGSSYYQNKYFFQNYKYIRWNIVEQDKVVNFGKKYFKKQNLYFFEKIEDALKASNSKIVLFNNVLQYLENPYAIINSLKKYKGLTIIIDKIIFTKNNEDIVLIQKNPKRIYNSSYPIRIFSRSKFNRYLIKNFKIYSSERYNYHLIDFENKKYNFETLIIKS